MTKWLKVLFNLVFVGAILWSVYWVISNRNDILDWYYLRDYKPPAQIEELATQAAMTEQGRKIFFRADPEIDPDRQTLARDCRIDDERTIELGCYLTSNKIYLLEIQQTELRSEMVVTAAHEMLHAAYERLSRQERQDLDNQLLAAAKSINDPRLQKRLDDYGELEPADRNNELHSILGTEFANIPANLETHYAKYISDRSVVVAYSDEFNRTFDGLREEIRQLEVRIQATKARMELLKSRNQISAYNNLVPVVNSDINLYNSKVEQYNRYSNVLLGNQTQAAPQ